MTTKGTKTKKTGKWLIYNKHARLWWSNKHGWVDRKSATPFTVEQRNVIRYLPGVGSTWVRKQHN